MEGRVVRGGLEGGGGGREREERWHTADKRIERLVHAQQRKNGLYPEHVSDLGVSEMKQFNCRPLGLAGLNCSVRCVASACARPLTVSLSQLW